MKKEKWNELSMKDRAAYIKVGVENGITDLDFIRSRYNKFVEGGFTESKDEDSPVFPQHLEGFIPPSYQGEIRQAPTTFERIIYRTKDIGRSAAAFIPFLGTALDFYDDNMQQVPTGAAGDAADILSYGSGKLSEYADNINPNQTKTITVGRGKHRHRAVVHKDLDKAINKGLSKIGSRVARGLGLIGYVIDTPNFVSDIENMKRALGFDYNAGLILK